MQESSAHSHASSAPALTVGALAEALRAEILGDPGDARITHVEAVERAGPGAITFIRSARFAKDWPACGASAAVVSRGVTLPPGGDPSRSVLLVDDADRAMVRVLEMLAPQVLATPPGVHPDATVSASARLGAGVAVGPRAVIGHDSAVGEGTVLGAGVVIGRGVTIGRRCVLHPGVVVQDRCVIGDSCIIHPNATIGGDGFGYAASEDGRGVLKIPHIGTVRIGDHVEIGAGTTIDRAKFGATTVGSGTKIDNLVQVGHNCVIGRGCIICGQCGLSGSVTLGDGVQLGGGVGVADHARLGDGARVAASSGVLSDIPAGETWGGTPAVPLRDALRNAAALRNIADTLRDLRRAAGPTGPGDAPGDGR